MKQWLIVLVVLGLLSMLIIGCGESGTTSDSPNTVHTQGANFVQSSITISKGSMLTLVDDDATVHIIANGSWVNGVPTSASEVEHRPPTTCSSVTMAVYRSAHST